MFIGSDAKSKQLLDWFNHDPKGTKEAWPKPRQLTLDEVTVNNEF
ncbi:hypothetical protein [Rubripirellula reticaptiva]|nr:hypothetical protein [Rubripirellula reticaptiva]